MNVGRPVLTRHWVPLDHVPESFRVPENLEGRFRYDPTDKRLSFDGYMCKATFDRLRMLGNEFDYQRALERLFQLSVPEEPRAAHKSLRLVVAARSFTAAITSRLGALVHHHS